MSTKLPLLCRAAYVVLLFVLTLLVAASSLREWFEDVAPRVIAALSAIDPFYLLQHMFGSQDSSYFCGKPDSVYSPNQWPPGLPPQRVCYDPGGWIRLFAQGGWLALLLVGGPLLAYMLLRARARYDSPGSEFTTGIVFLVGLPLTGLVSFGLKWLLIGMMYALGAAFGFVSWINLTIITTIEAFLHLHHVMKDGAEVKEVIKEITAGH